MHLTLLEFHLFCYYRLKEKQVYLFIDLFIYLYQRQEQVRFVRLSAIIHRSIEEKQSDVIPIIVDGNSSSEVTSLVISIG